MGSSEQLMGGGGGLRYVKMPSEPSSSHPLLNPQSSSSSFFIFHQGLTPESGRIFEELPKVTIVSVSRPDPADISPMLLSYTIEVHYKQFKWRLLKKAAQVFYLHFALKKRAFFEEIHEKQEQVKEWLQNLGIGDHAPVVQDEDDVEDDTVPLNQEDSAKNRQG